MKRIFLLLSIGLLGACSEPTLIVDQPGLEVRKDSKGVLVARNAKSTSTLHLAVFPLSTNTDASYLKFLTSRTNKIANMRRLADKKPGSVAEGFGKEVLALETELRKTTQARPGLSNMMAFTFLREAEIPSVSFVSGRIVSTGKCEFGLWVESTAVLSESELVDLGASIGQWVGALNLSELKKLPSMPTPIYDGNGVITNAQLVKELGQLIGKPVFVRQH